MCQSLDQNRTIEFSQGNATMQASVDTLGVAPLQYLPLTSLLDVQIDVAKPEFEDQNRATEFSQSNAWMAPLQSLGVAPLQ